MTKELKVSTDKMLEGFSEATLEVLNIYTDDHEACVDVGITLKGEDKQYKIACMCIIPEFVAALIYMCKGPEFKEERESFVRYVSECIVEQVNDCYQYGDDLDEDELKQIEFLQKFAI